MAFCTDEQIKKEPVIDDKGTWSTAEGYIENNIKTEPDSRDWDINMTPKLSIRSLHKSDLMTYKDDVTVKIPENKHDEEDQKCIEKFILKSMQAKPPKVHTCNICLKEFSQINHLRDHSVTHTGEKTHECHICHNKFTVRSSLTKHILLVHEGEKKFECTICYKKFARKTSLTQHNFTHSGEKLFNCNLCDKGFSMKGHLKRHITSHMGEKPFQCKFCLMRFTENGSLKKHTQNLHANELQAESASSLCSTSKTSSHFVSTPSATVSSPCNFKMDKTDNLKHAQKESLFTYLSYRFVCDICDKRFERRGNLKKHLLIHNEDKQFECPVCHKKFTQKGHRNRHVLIHSRKGEYTLSSSLSGNVSNNVMDTEKCITEESDFVGSDTEYKEKCFCIKEEGINEADGLLPQDDECASADDKQGIKIEEMNRYVKTEIE